MLRVTDISWYFGYPFQPIRLLKTSIINFKKTSMYVMYLDRSTNNLWQKLKNYQKGNENDSQ
jgi:hypothetical protein